jgi:drug/metabolite transporter (DMT)-like permease
MSNVFLILVGTQLIYSISDFMGRYFMSKHGFHGVSFLMPWFLWYQLIRQVAMMGQLYIFAVIPLGKTMAMFGAASIVVSNVLGILFLKEVLSPVAYVGVMMAVVAVLIMAFR